MLMRVLGFSISFKIVLTQFAFQSFSTMKCYLDKFFSRDKIEVKDNIVEYYTTNKKEAVIKLECDIETKKMKASQSKDNVHFVSLPDEEICRNGRIVISDDGSRWEGDCYNNQPFGFGSFYDGEGSRIYSGFMFEGKKVGFGTEYFADIYKVDYCGNFINNKRHGWGTTYNRNGQKLYEGEWKYGINQFSSCIVGKDKKDFEMINLSVNELIIEDNCFDSVKSLGAIVIDNIELLQYILIGKNNFSKAWSFTVRNCKELCLVSIEDGAFSYVKNVIVESISGVKI